MTDENRIVVLGTGGVFTYHVFKTLLDNACVPLAYIQSGRARAHLPSHFADITIQTGHNLPDDGLSRLLDSYSVAHHFESATDIQDLVGNLDTHFLLVACWPKLISVDVIQSVSKAALNLHPSLLPKYRGINPVTAQLSEGDVDFGVTLHLLNNQFDKGDIVLQQPFRIKGITTVTDINKKAAALGADLFLQAINTFHEPGWCPQKQY